MKDELGEKIKKDFAELTAKRYCYSTDNKKKDLKKGTQKYVIK